MPNYTQWYADIRDDIIVIRSKDIKGENCIETCSHSFNTNFNNYVNGVTKNVHPVNKESISHGRAPKTTKNSPPVEKQIQISLYGKNQDLVDLIINQLEDMEIQLSTALKKRRKIAFTVLRSGYMGPLKITTNDAETTIQLPLDNAFKTVIQNSALSTNLSSLFTNSSQLSTPTVSLNSSLVTKESKSLKSTNDNTEQKQILLPKNNNDVSPVTFFNDKKRTEKDNLHIESKKSRKRNRSTPMRSADY